MKFALIVVSLLFACGRSECQDYATVYCQKAASCGLNVGSFDFCEKEVKHGLEASRTAEEQCKTAREVITAQTCVQFRAFLASLTQ